MPARLAFVLLVALACSSGSATQHVVTLRGRIANIDTINQTITLSSSGEGSRSIVFHYNSLTIVDLPTGSAHVDVLQFGDNIIVDGRQDLATEEITADRIVMNLTPGVR